MSRDNDDESVSLEAIIPIESCFNILEEGRMSDLLQLKAKIDLNERVEELDAVMCAWSRRLISMKHFRCPQTQTFLLPFLRYSKYQYDQAMSRIENYCSLLKSPEHGRPNWFTRLSSKSAFLVEFKKINFLTPLGYIGDDGPLVVFIRFNDLNLDRLPMPQLTSCVHTMLEFLTSIERVQISGVILVIDLDHRSFYYDNPLDIFNLYSKWIQDALPIRIIEMIFFNKTKLFEYVYKLAEPFLSNETRQKITLCTEEPYNLEKFVPGIKKLLPKEYDGENFPLDELNKSSYKLFFNFLDNTHEPFIFIDDSYRSEK